VSGAVLPSGPARAQATQGKIVVLGFDGADARLTEQYMNEGLLPNLARLRDEGTFAPLGTTTPAQTPVSWSSFATGRNPGKNGIFDFLRRDLKTYQPDFAMYEIGKKPFLLGGLNHFLIAGALFVLALILGSLLGAIGKHPRRGLAVGALAGVLLAVAAVIWTKDLLPAQIPTVENTRKGNTFWEIAGEAGVKSTIVRVPATFPPREFEGGHILAGLGVPDVRGTLGTFTYYTTEPLTGALGGDTEMGGKIIEVALVNGETDSYVFGPRNQLFPDAPDVVPDVSFKLDRSATPARVTVDFQGQSLTIAVGEWSDWVSMEFQFTPVVKLYGLARFYFNSSEPFGLYMSAINFDPHRPPPVAISEPPEFCKQLTEDYGTYKTLGWGMETWALNELRIDEKTFLEDAYFTERKFAEMMRGMLDGGDFKLYVQVFELTDRVAHMFWRLLDPEHPSYDADLAATYGSAVRDAYQFMDKVVGEARDRMGPDDILLICSDHGFHTWHKSVNYNTWLVRNGFMTLTSNTPGAEMKLEDLFGKGQFWPNVDWSRTKAYALGLGDIYINVRGREGQGIVEPGEEYERIRNQLIEQLEAFVDPENGEHPVRKVFRREDVYNGFDKDLIPDLLAANSPKYRVSWQTSLGGIPRDLLEVNARKWSGDHCSLDPRITKGVFFSNRRLRAEDANILDLMPTILGYLDLPVPGDVDGKRLVEAGS
jgi:predicted AlkP superfamily phosphohydrolase/phosphomutase